MPYQLLLDAMSAPRISSYRSIFKTQNTTETFGAYSWGQAINATLQPFICTCEVALRNAIHKSLSLQASSAIAGGPFVSFPWYDYKQGWRTLQGETYEKVEKILCDRSSIRKAIQPAPDMVVADLSLGIWPNILVQQLNRTEEVKTFEDVFPHHPKLATRHWRFEVNRKEAVERCRDLQRLRNRISHCGPVWSSGWLQTQPVRHWTRVIDNLKSRHASLLEMLSWISASTATVHALSFASDWFTQLCSEDAVIAFMTDPIKAGKILPIPLAMPEVRAIYMNLART